MEYLEDFIVQHRALFDQDEPPQGHEERFFAKWAHATATQSSSPSKREVNMFVHTKPWGRLYVAAAAIIVLLAGWGVMEFTHSESVVEARNLRHYQHRIADLQKQLSYSLSSLSPVDMAQIEEAILMFTQNVDEFTNLLPNELSPDQRREALDNYYTQNIEGMKQAVALVTEYTSYMDLL